MAKTKTAEELKDALEKEKQHIEDRYTQILDTLEYERDRIQNELRREFRTARRYVRANPEIGVGAAFAGGILAGVLLSTLFKSN
ncbi:hypothetical protein [Rhodohalobacter sp. 8-1]|uniref:hypothetical protein n=1 Tax=Rhodohalobacter sp. 8-1 TaxID=3131972 RepID=UPI0030EE1869